MARVVLTKEQYENDEGFKAIFAQLQQGNDNLANRQPVRVTFETRNGVWIYIIGFEFDRSASSFESSFNPITREVQLLSGKSSTRAPAIPPIQPSTPGGNVPRTQLTQAQYANDEGFLIAQQTVQQSNQLSQGFVLNRVSFTITSGQWVYSLEYIRNGIELIVFEVEYNPNNDRSSIIAVAQSSISTPPVP